MREQMTTFNKVVRVLASAGIGLCFAASSYLWGGGAVIIALLAIAFSDISMYAGSVVIKRHWRKQIYHCHTCLKEIPGDSETKITFTGTDGKPKHYDTVECMSAGIKEVVT